MRSDRFQRAWPLLAIIAAGCATQPQPPASPPAPAAGKNSCGTAPTFAEGGERATLWVRTSAEFRAASEATYRAARAALEAGLADPTWTAEPTQTGDLSALPPAVVMDIDETVLDNSAPQAQMLLDEICLEEFPAAWDAWVAKRSAPAVPGAAEFIRSARAMTDPAGRAVRVFLITNRECARREGDDSACPQEADTLANLRSLGLDSPTLADDLMLKGEREDWASEKLARRRAIAPEFRIVLNIGDDLADFLPDVRRAAPLARERARCAADPRWGRQWFLLPNPMYGSWLVALGQDFRSALTAEPQVKQDCQDP
jgi:5'-nucleotidase (lipoprotein e(P4) family)